MSPRGDVVSAAGRQRTIDVFGAPLSPQQVVQKICDDVRTEGTAAVLRYGRQLDQAELVAESLQVPLEELAAAHDQTDAGFLST